MFLCRVINVPFSKVICSLVYSLQLLNIHHTSSNNPPLSITAGRLTKYRLKSLYTAFKGSLYTRKSIAFEWAFGRNKRLLGVVGKNAS